MENSPIFWNTQGSIIYDTEKNYFNYETSMSVNWENKLARRVLITIMKLFGRPEILDVKKNGIAIWTNNLKNTIFYKIPTIFKEICIRDEYVHDIDGVFNPKYPFLTVSYKFKLDEKYISSLSEFHNYISYDSHKYMLHVKSRTLEENIIILNIFLGNGRLNRKNIPLTIKKRMKDLNAKDSNGFMDQIKNDINTINSKANIVDIPVAKQTNLIVEEEENNDTVDSEMLLSE
tara:strand:- start:1319 stop:2014 length:696 start_codon:yes stop_codon:yes gene_type:complete